MELRRVIWITTIILAVTTCSWALQHECSHHKVLARNRPIASLNVDHRDRHPNLQDQDQHQRKKRDIGHHQWQPIRIHPHYVNDKIQLKKESFRFLRHRIIPDVLRYFKYALSVQPIDHPLQFQACQSTFNATTQQCRTLQPIQCGPNHVTDHLAERHYRRVQYCNSSTCRSYGGEGIANADYLLYIYSISDEICQSGSLAYASVCGESQSTGRPVLGYINFCPNTFNESHDYQSLRNIAIHELFHTLGLSAAYFTRFRKRDGSTYSAVETIKVHGREVKAITSPKVMEVARKYFNCHFIAGVELEDEGALGHLSSHWEMRILRHEIMTAASTISLGRLDSVSEFTLALMEDSGWYIPNYKALFKRKMWWGKGLGCHFLYGNCSNPRHYPYACDNIHHSGCTDDYDAWAKCDTNKWMNNCKVNTAYIDGVCSDHRNAATVSDLNGNCGPKFARNSRCLLSTLTSTKYHRIPSGFCMDMTCVNNTYHSKIQIVLKYNGYEALCFNGGEIIQFPGCNGFVQCPSIEKACIRPYMDNNGILPILCSDYCLSCSLSTSCNQCMPGYHIHKGLCFKNTPTTPPSLTRSATRLSSTPSYTIINLLPIQRQKATPTPMSTILVGNRSASLSDKLWHIRKAPVKNPYFHYSQDKATPSKATMSTLLPNMIQVSKDNKTHSLNISSHDSNATTTINGASVHHLNVAVDGWSSALHFVTTHYWLVITASACLSAIVIIAIICKLNAKKNEKSKSQPLLADSKTSFEKGLQPNVSAMCSFPLNKSRYDENGLRLTFNKQSQYHSGMAFV